MTFNKPSMNGLNHFSIEEVNEDIANLETTKQNLLTAGTNITINGDEISATGGGTTYTAGSNISISESNVISATDTNTEYTAGTNVSISAGNEISSTDTDTTYTAGTNVNISAGNEISSTDTDTTYTAGTNVSISAGNVISTEYIKPQLALFGYDKDNIGSSNWGNGSSQTTIVSDRRVGDSFCSTSSGIITLSKAGMYRIRVSAQTQSDGYNDRVSFMNYLRINGTGYQEEEDKNFFGWTYIRNNSDGGHGSVSFEDYIYLNANSTIQPRHRLETTGDRNFNNTLPAANIDNYLNIQIERLYDSNAITGS